MIQRVEYKRITKNDDGQRVDNYLLKIAKGVPKSRIYRAIRSGEVRVNKKRVKQNQRLVENDMLRVPPLATKEQNKRTVMLTERERKKIQQSILSEDGDFIFMNKPAGISVHSGTGQSVGLIDKMQAFYGEHLYLVHRLDRDVSGCLMITRSRKALVEIQSLWNSHLVNKIYHAIVFFDGRKVEKIITSSIKTKSGKDQYAKTMVKVLKAFPEYLLLEVQIETGRKHQIRRHLSEAGLPIVGDEKYGDYHKNKNSTIGSACSGLMLHARKLSIRSDFIQKEVVSEYGEHIMKALSLLDQ